MVSVPRELLALGFANNLGGESLELTQRGHSTPHLLLNHLAHVQSCPRWNCPAPLQTDLENGSEDTAGGLLDVDHVSDESETLELETRDVGLQEDVDLRGGLFDGLFDGNGNTFEELAQL